MKIININLNPKNTLHKRLVQYQRYFIIDCKKKCHATFVKHFEKENRFIFKNVYYFNYTNSDNLSTTILFIDKIVKIDFNLPEEIQNLIEEYY
jgi:hypothetical protein